MKLYVLARAQDEPASAMTTLLRFFFECSHCVSLTALDHPTFRLFLSQVGVGTPEHPVPDARTAMNSHLKDFYSREWLDTQKRLSKHCSVGIQVWLFICFGRLIYDLLIIHSLSCQGIQMYFFWPIEMRLVQYATPILIQACSLRPGKTVAILSLYIIDLLGLIHVLSLSPTCEIKNIHVLKNTCTSD